MEMLPKISVTKLETTFSVQSGLKFYLENGFVKHFI